MTRIDLHQRQFARQSPLVSRLIEAAVNAVHRNNNTKGNITSSGRKRRYLTQFCQKLTY